MLALRKAGWKYVVRTSVAAYDFTLGDFTLDATAYTLDISSIVPANAKAVHFHVDFAHGTLGKYLVFKADSDNPTSPEWLLYNEVAGSECTAQMGPIACRSSKTIGYRGQAGFTAINVTVIGWWI